MAETHPAIQLVRWYEGVARPLPWRTTRDPYKIWLSEVMLQQTRVATVLSYYARFLERFPTLESFAAGSDEAVLELWSGLGYYSRARNLLKGARTVVNDFGGKLPSDPARLREIPGIGPYTAGAIASIAFDVPAPLVDGNVERVFSRYFAMSESLGSRAARDFFWAKAEEWVRASGNPRFFNQALMELGATVCSKTKPECGRCPLNAGCVARAQGKQEDFPVRKARRKAVPLQWQTAIAEDDSHRVYVVSAQRGRWWEGLVDFPRTDTAEFPETKGTPLRPVLHTVTHHRIEVSPVHFAKAKRAKWESTFANGRWVTAEELTALPLSGLARKVAQRWIDQRE